MTDAARLHALADAAYRLRAGSAGRDDRLLLGGVGLQPLTGGSNNPLYRFDLDGRALCLKLPLVDDRRRAEREWRALTLLSRRGSPAVPEPVWRSERPDRPAIVMTHADGSALGSGPLAPRQLDALAGALTDVYAITPDAVAESFPDVVTPAPAMLARVHRTWAELHATGPEVAADRHDLFVAWRRWYSGPEPQRLIAPTARAFGRGDPSLANLLWDGTRLTLLDFEYSGWTDPAFELADLVEHTQSRATPDHTWDQLIGRLDLDPAARERHHAARRLMCLFWTARWWHHQGHFTLQAARTRHLFADLLNPRPGR